MRSCCHPSSPRRGGGHGDPRTKWTPRNRQGPGIGWVPDQHGMGLNPAAVGTALAIAAASLIAFRRKH